MFRFSDVEKDITSNLIKYRTVREISDRDYDYVPLNTSEEKSVDDITPDTAAENTVSSDVPAKKKTSELTLIAVVVVLAAFILAGILLSKNNDKSNSSERILNESVVDIIEFGSYPQSRVTDESIISALDGVEKNWISYGYYVVTGEFDGNMKPSDFMKYSDISYNGEKYRAVTFSEYRPVLTADGDLLDSEYAFQAQNGYYTGQVYYFKYEPLKWRVLDPTDGFVMCNMAIDSQVYQNVIYNKDGEYYNSKSCEHYASDWETSSIRKWLNEDFYNTAFTDSEKSQISTTHLKNKSTDENKYDSADTNDKIYLLSYEDALNGNYGFDSEHYTYDTARQIKSTDYAQCQGCYKHTDGNSWWRLRSPFDYSGVAGVDYIGGAHSSEHVYYTSNGIVPAFKFNNPQSLLNYKT